MDELNKFYKEYGEFIILFEKINSTMSRIIRKVCTAGKLFTEEDNRILILLEGLTAYPILTKFYHIVKSSEIFDDKELFSLIELFYKECQSLIELRNNLAHGTFSIGDPYGNLNNFELSKPKI
ncbi:hypothetical protein AS361_15845 [Myroides marinus]|uniref:hypothetical protein n=1 Tax=Myroides TaxID=76831 RepID=UPI000280AA30|nr:MULTISPECIES: hypothetical protein [Myroides]EKB06379.1 hypothetical protein HMPREF9711_00751 [Myroides odoratimimus CCUG 3837]KUF44522.1 hypothetical protein AS361_15845 [Myroides marinus]